MSELIRRNSLLRPLPRRISKIELDTYTELGRIGNNLNQLTKALNTAIKIGERAQIDPIVLADLKELLHQVRRELISFDGGEDDDFNSEERDDWETD